MTVGELVDQLVQFDRQKQVKVRHGDGMNPNHYAFEVVENGYDEPVILVTWRTDDPEDRHLPS